MGVLGFLLDSHIWYWWTTNYERIPSPVRRRIGRAGVRLYLSSATSYEIALKHAQGKLRLPASPSDFVSSLIGQGAIELPMTSTHALRAAALPPHHNDPFDRVLIAQAQIEALQLVTADPRILAYDVAALNAGK